MKVIIEGSIVKVVEETILRQCSTQEFADNLSTAVPVSSGILPKNAIFFRKTGKLMIYAIELPQREVAIRWCPRRNREAERTMRLSLPFTQFYCSFNSNGSAGNLYLSCTKKPVKSLDDAIFVIPLPNQFSDGQDRVCTGDMSFPVEMPSAQKMEAMVQAFFTNAFNDDLSMRYPDCLKVEGKDSLTVWEEKSAQNRMYAISDEFKPTPHNAETFGLMLEGLGR